MTTTFWKALTTLVMGVSLMIVASLPWLNIEEMRVVGLIMAGFGAVATVKQIWE